MEVWPELSLGPTTSLGLGFAKSSSSTGSDSGSSSSGSRKRRKPFVWEEDAAVSRKSLELQLTDPLPLDWEQCLDLHSGRMYYLNRKTMRKSWVRPREEQGATLDLELNISTIPSTFAGKANTSPFLAEETDSEEPMVAVPCANCHLLVMVSMSSPECPNCRFVHAEMLRMPPRRVLAKPLETLSLLH